MVIRITISKEIIIIKGIIIMTAKEEEDVEEIIIIIIKEEVEVGITTTITRTTRIKIKQKLQTHQKYRNVITAHQMTRIRLLEVLLRQWQK